MKNTFQMEPMKIPTIQGHFYSMSGHDTSGAWFQYCMQNGLHESKVECPRISLTFRLTSTLAQQIAWKPLKSKLEVKSIDNFHSVSFQDMMQELQPSLKTDVTSVFGKTSSNMAECLQNL